MSSANAPFARDVPFDVELVDGVIDAHGTRHADRTCWLARNAGRTRGPSRSQRRRTRNPGGGGTFDISGNLWCSSCSLTTWRIYSALVTELTGHCDTTIAGAARTFRRQLLRQPVVRDPFLTSFVAADTTVSADPLPYWVVHVTETITSATTDSTPVNLDERTLQTAAAAAGLVRVNDVFCANVTQRRQVAAWLRHVAATGDTATAPIYDDISGQCQTLVDNCTTFWEGFDDEVVAFTTPTWSHRELGSSFSGGPAPVDVITFAALCGRPWAANGDVLVAVLPAVIIEANNTSWGRMVSYGTLPASVGDSADDVSELIGTLAAFDVAYSPAERSSLAADLGLLASPR